MRQQAEGVKPKAFVSQGLQPVNPFWADLPHSDIFQCFTPNIHHQLNNALYSAYCVSWCIAAAERGSDELNRHFKSMTKHPTLRHFKTGISVLTQWTGNEYRNMEKTFLGVIAGTVDEQVVQALHAVVDFITYAHFEAHTETSLEKMDRAWSVIHEHKSIFVDLGICKSFNIPKFHSLIHYVSAIRSHGTLDGYNTESPERLHIDFAKVPFQAGNKWDYTAQMATWMHRHDAYQCHDTFLNWAKAEGIVEEDDEAEPKRKWQHGDDESKVRVCCGYKVAKKPRYSDMTVDDLIKYRTADKSFMCYLDEFLRAHSIPIPPSHNILFGIFKCLSVTLPQIPQVSDPTDLEDTIRTILPEPSRDRKAAVAAHFDTVLAFEKPGLTALSDLLDPLKGAYL